MAIGKGIECVLICKGQVGKLEEVLFLKDRVAAVEATLRAIPALQPRV